MSRQFVWRLPLGRRLACALRRVVLRRRHARRTGKYRHIGATLEALAEMHAAIAEREKCVVLTHSDILAGPELRSALTHDNVAAGDGLAAKNLHAEPLARRVAPVP